MAARDNHFTVTPARSETHSFQLDRAKFDEVKSLSPELRYVIALHSFFVPIETGLLGWHLEKKAQRVVNGVP